MSLRKRFVKFSVWSVLLYGYETWTLKKANEKRLQTGEMWFWKEGIRVFFSHW